MQICTVKIKYNASIRLEFTNFTTIHVHRTKKYNKLSLKYTGIEIEARTLYS